jgi:putative acetyltransferase
MTLATWSNQTDTETGSRSGRTPSAYLGRRAAPTPARRRQPAAGTTAGVLIRQERPDDAEAVDAVHRAAFAAGGAQPTGAAEPEEVALVRALRADAGWVPALSLVAEGPDGAVVGHVVGTVGTLGGVAAVGLGPLGVVPDHQRAGVGAALVHTVLGAADALGFPVVVLLGDPGYYRRFGFVPARSLGITAPDPAWAEHLQARALRAWDPALTGTFRYAAPFHAA